MNRYERYKDSGIPWLGEIPEDWEVKRLKFLAKIQNGTDYKHVETNDGYPVIGSGGQFAYANSYLYDGESVLLGRKGTIDKPLYVKGAFWTVDTMYYTEILKNTYPKYFYYLTLTIDFGRYSTQTALPSMTQTALNNLIFAVPNYAEQTAIAHYLDTKLDEIDALIDKQQTLLEKLAEQRTAVITHAVTKGLNPAAPMKKSGVEWLGDVPAHWDVKKFKHLCKIITGYTPSKNNDENYDENGFLWVKPDNLNDFKEISDTKEKISVVGLKSNYLIPKDSILVCSIGTIGKMGVAMQDVVTNQQINSFIFNELVNKSFSKYLIYSAKGIFEHMANDNVVRILNSNTQKNIFSPLPPLIEQAEIADYLDKETAKLDRLCETVNQTIGRLKEYRTALITQAVTGKIKVTDE